jgi:hypothetical protein
LRIIIDLGEQKRSQGKLNGKTVALESSFSFQGQSVWGRRPSEERLFTYCAYLDFLLPSSGYTGARVCPYHSALGK